MGCNLHAEDGHHQASRETWGQDARDRGWDLRYFVGRGTTALKEDEVRFDVPDNKETLLYKVCAILDWAVERDYGLIFKVNTNTYVNVQEVAKHNYEGSDYVGNVVGRLGVLYANTEAYGFVQGSASWLSAKAARIVAKEAIPLAMEKFPQWVKYSGVISPYPHSEDLWIGQVLTPRFDELKVHVDRGYSNGPLTYWSQSNYIKNYCLSEWMHALHAARPNSDTMDEINRQYQMKGLQ